MGVNPAKFIPVNFRQDGGWEFTREWVRKLSAGPDTI